MLSNTAQSHVNVIYSDSDIRSSASNFDRSFLRLFYASYRLKCQYFQLEKAQMTPFLAVCHALSIGCNTGKSGVSMTSIAPEITESSHRRMTKI